jgi:hypothetical protein
MVIEGIGHINTMEDVAMTCANICGVILAIVDITATKTHPLAVHVETD